MDERFKYGKRYWYPHMKPADIAIWERFCDKYPDFFDECQYDLAVGTGAAFDTNVSEETGGDAATLYRRKIDVVGWKDGQCSIVEVKPRGGPSALGQVTGYVHLYEQDFKPAASPKVILLTDELLPDMTMLAAKFGVRLIIV